MKRRTGFTLIELMIVVLIVAVLAAVLVPFMRARVEAAKWSEGKAGAGTIGSALRAYSAEQGIDGSYNVSLIADVLFKISDLEGKYFQIGDYALTSVSFVEDRSPFPLQYLIRVDKPSRYPGWKISAYTLSHEGVWTEVP